MSFVKKLIEIIQNNIDIYCITGFSLKLIEKTENDHIFFILKIFTLPFKICFILYLVLMNLNYLIFHEKIFNKYILYKINKLLSNNSLLNFFFTGNLLGFIL